MPVFSSDMLVCATVYIKAETAEEAAAKLAAMDRNFGDFKPQVIAKGVEVSGLPFQHKDLPEISISPVMTAYPVKVPYDGIFMNSKPLTADDLEECE